MSKSMTEFWRRWHITLGKWFKDYIYIPLGGNRKGTGRLILNLLVVWLFTGLWHGASWNYIIWGLSLFMLIVLEKLWLKPYLDNSRILARLYMLLVIPVTWILFAINDFRDMATYLGRMFSLVPGVNVNTGDFTKYLVQYKWLLLFGIFFCFPYGQKWFDKHKHSVSSTVVLFIVFWYCIYQLANGINNPFMYFQF
jgi:alginate O-acetyltransferase complex protein AlgI